MSIVKVFYRSPHNYDLAEASQEAAKLCEPYGESLTVQSQAEDADINVLMKRFGVTGQMPQSMRLPEYGDFMGVRDYQSALQAVMDAQDSFMELPANIRSRFDNSPQKFLEFVSQESNFDELRKMGLAKALPEVPVPVAEVK